MIYIFLSVCCSVFVSVLLKLSKPYEIDNRQAITWNYSIAAFLTWLIYKPEILDINPIYISLGLLLPSLFLILALSVRYTGIVKTDIAQRLSLFIPVLASYILFSETFSGLKIIGVIIAFIAIILSIPWEKEKDLSGKKWMYPLIVFLGMGTIDILFKQIAKTTSIPFTSSLMIVFPLAFLVSFSYLLLLYFTGKMKFQLINVICGWILGIANFGNILFYLKAHQALSETPSMVFSTMNIGVILLGTLVGIFIFKEKLSRLNYLGIVLAIISITVLYYAA